MAKGGAELFALGTVSGRPGLFIARRLVRMAVVMTAVTAVPHFLGMAPRAFAPATAERPRQA